MNPLHPRIAGAFANRPLYEQFVVAAICAALGEKKTQALVDSFFGADIDWQEIVAGRPLHYYNGKNVPSLYREGLSEETVDAVRKAYAARGLEFPERDDNPPDAPPADLPDFVPSPGDEMPTDEATKNPAGDTPNTGATPTGRQESEKALAGAVEPVTPPPAGQTADRPASIDNIAVSGYRFADLRGKTDAQLRGMPNVGTATIAKVRALEAEYGTEAGTPVPPAPAAPATPPAAPKG